MYDILIALVAAIQIFHFSKSLDVEFFKQSIRYYSFCGYSYIRKWFLSPQEKVIITPVVVEKYEDKYKKEFNIAESCKSTENLKYSILMENTPNGNVIMFYENGSFVYYSDKIIPYRFLDTVGRKYAIYFKCKNVYIVDKSQLQKKDAIANKYTYQGKIVNFSFLQKVKKNATNKKLNMSFKDFKKI